MLINLSTSGQGGSIRGGGGKKTRIEGGEGWDATSGFNNASLESLPRHAKFFLNSSRDNYNDKLFEFANSFVIEFIESTLLVASKKQAVSANAGCFRKATVVGSRQK